MRTPCCILLALLGATSLLCAAPQAEVKITEGAKGVKVVTHQRWAFSLSYEASMEGFAKANLTAPHRSIVFTGSSSMVLWKNVARDMAPLPAVNRAFGGSVSPQLWWYADRAVLPLQPRVVVIYIGDNDLASPSVTPGNYMKYVRLFRDEIWAADPQTRLVFISSKPSPSRWQFWPKFQEANRRLARMCSRDPRLAYVDISPTLLDAQGQVRPECFLDDKLHMKQEMYAEWTRVVRPVVERMWQQAKAH